MVSDGYGVRNITSRGKGIKCWPPSTIKVVPVIAGASARKQTAPAMSSGVLDLPSGVTPGRAAKPPRSGRPTPG